MAQNGELEQLYRTAMREHNKIFDDANCEIRSFVSSCVLFFVQNESV